MTPSVALFVSSLGGDCRNISWWFDTMLKTIWYPYHFDLCDQILGFSSIYPFMHSAFLFKNASLDLEQLEVLALNIKAAWVLSVPTGLISGFHELEAHSFTSAGTKWVENPCFPTRWVIWKYHKTSEVIYITNVLLHTSRNEYHVLTVTLLWNYMLRKWSKIQVILQGEGLWIWMRSHLFKDAVW